MTAEFSLSILLLLSLVLCRYAWAQQDSCGSIGNSDETRITARRNELFYLNTGNPAPCPWNVTSWRVCYYGRGDDLEDNQRRSYLATYAIYRLMGSGSNERYERVSEIFTGTVSTSNIAGGDTVDATVQQNGFTCFDDSTSAPVMVESGDIVGACVFRPPDFIPNFITTRELDVVGETSGESLQVLTDVSGCSRTEIPSNIQTSQLSTRNSRRLHIYANIVSTGQPTTTEIMTTDLEPPASTAPAAASELPTSTTLVTPESDSIDHQTTANMTISQQGQSPGTITIATVSGVCGLSLLLLTFVTVILIILYFWLKKRRKFKLTRFVPTNTETDTRNNEFTATVTINATYNLSRPPQLAAELDVIYDSVRDIQFNNGDRGDPNLLTLEQNTVYNTSTLPMEQNAAYSTSYHDSVLPLTTNVAYYSHTETTTTNCEDYDYVYQ